MNTIAYSLVFACVLGSVLITATPVYPALPLKHFSPVDICLFICNICFDEMGPEMMDCANHVCLAKEQYEMNLGLLKVGRTCKNYNKLDSFVMGNDSE